MEEHLALSMLVACYVYPNRLNFCQRIAASSSPLSLHSAYSATIAGNILCCKVSRPAEQHSRNLRKTTKKGSPVHQEVILYVCTIYFG